MDVDKELIKKVSSLAKLELLDEEIEEFIPQFKEVLETFSALQEVDTDNTKPSFQPVEIKDALREDIEENSLTKEEALSLTEHKKDGFFKGPKAV